MQGKRKFHNSMYLRFWVVVFIAIILLMVATYLGLTSTHFIIVSGHSMEPTYSDGEQLRAKTDFTEEDLKGNPVCWVELDDGSVVIKRLIGLPGETVHLIDGATFVDGRLIMEAFEGNSDNLIQSLGTDEYFFLGDNRNDSYDGRYWDPPYVHLENIKGIVLESYLS